jgi:hypothetical protein
VKIFLYPTLIAIGFIAGSELYKHQIKDSPYLHVDHAGNPVGFYWRNHTYFFEEFNDCKLPPPI